MLDKSSFIHETLEVKHAVVQSFMRDTGGTVQSHLKRFDDFIQEMSDYVTHGVKINVAKGVPVSIDAEGLKQAIGSDLFEELLKIAQGGRGFLDSIGYDGRPRPQKSVLIGGRNTGAAVLVQTAETELLGEPPLTTVKITGINPDAGEKVSMPTPEAGTNVIPIRRKAPRH